MKNNDIIYLNFPIPLLETAFEDIKGSIDEIMNFATYRHSKTLEFGTEKERMQNAAKFFNIKFGNIDFALSSGKQLMTKYGVGYPNASINIEMSWDFYKNKKSEFEIACFCAFCAIKSILEVV